MNPPFFGKIMKRFLFCLLLAPIISYAGDKPESYYQTKDCANRGGVAEYINSDGTRTDCLTATQSIEHDFANKWYECITQSLHYAILNNNHPICVLIIEKDSQIIYVDRARLLIKEYGLPVHIDTIK